MQRCKGGEPAREIASHGLEHANWGVVKTMGVKLVTICERSG